MKIRMGIWVMVLSGLVSGSTIAALNGYLTVVGQMQGEIKGSVTQKGRENQIAVYGFTHTYNTVVDPKSCLPGEIRNHSPLTIVKEFDRSTNGLMRAWMNHELLTVTLRLWRPSAIGAEEQYFTILLENDLLSGIHQESFNNKDSSLVNFPTMERISFSYESITQTWNPQPDEVLDSWTARCPKLDVISDLNFDGVVNILDFAIMADQWLMQSF
jgi:type VI secretion system secreted protein Hcp